MNGILTGFVSQNRLFVLTNNGAVWIYEGPEAQQLKLVYIWSDLEKRSTSVSSRISVEVRTPSNLWALSETNCSSSTLRTKVYRERPSRQTT
jgi:hypothetical protein